MSHMTRKLVFLAIAAALAAAAIPVAAETGHEAASAHAAAKAATAHGVGVVRSVDTAQGKVTLQHEPIESLGWPAMTMAFQVSDPKLLEGLAPGRKVQFAFVQKGRAYVITEIR
jgi:Cu(I)/Ag(I) efflux system protein CusF